jgi:hypothetical protein
MKEISDLLLLLVGASVFDSLYKALTNSYQA